MSFNDYLDPFYQRILKNLDAAAEKDPNAVKYLIAEFTTLALRYIEHREIVVRIIEQYILTVRESHFFVTSQECAVSALRAKIFGFFSSDTSIKLLHLKTF